jgi:hypothetical protein
LGILSQRAAKSHIDAAAGLVIAKPALTAG